MHGKSTDEDYNTPSREARRDPGMMREPQVALRAERDEGWRIKEQ